MRVCVLGGKRRWVFACNTLVVIYGQHVSDRFQFLCKGKREVARKCVCGCARVCGRRGGAERIEWDM